MTAIWQRWRDSETLRVFAVFFVGAALIHAPFVLTGFLEGGDNNLQLLPYKVFVGDVLQSGEFPLWNPLAGIGMPVAGNPQYGLFYPANALFVFFDPLVAQTIYVLLHLALSGAFTVRYLRELELGLPARIFGGVAYALCGPMLQYLTFLPMTAVFPWFPAAVLGLERFRRTRRWSMMVWTSFALALAVLAGHPPLGVNLWIGVGLYGLALSISRRDRQLFGALCGAAVLGVGLIAMLLLPVEMLLPELTLSTGHELNAPDGSFRPDLLRDFLFPGIHCELYVGLLPLALVGYAVYRRHQLSAAVRCWVFVAGAALLLMLGHFGPLWDYVSDLPILRNFRFPVRHDISLSLAVAVLSAVAIDRLAAATHDQVRAQLAWLKKHVLAVLFWVGLGVGVLAQIGVMTDEAARHQKRPNKRPLHISWRDGIPKHAARSTGLGFAVTALSAAGLALFVRDRQRGRWVLVPLLVLDLGSVSWGVRRMRQADPETIYENLEAKVIHRDYRGSAPPRIVTHAATPPEGHTLWGAVPFHYGFASYNIADSIEIRAFYDPLQLTNPGVVELMPRLLRQNRLLSLIGTNYIIAEASLWEELAPLHGRWGPPPESDPVAVIEVDRPPERQTAASIERHSLVLRAGDEPAALESTVQLAPHRTYEIVVEAAALEPTKEELRIGLFGPEGGTAVAPLLEVPASKLRHRFGLFRRAVPLGDRAGRLRLRAETESKQSIAIRRLLLRRQPLPRLREPPRAGADGRRPAVADLYRLVARHPPFQIRENRGAMPRAWLIREAIPVSDAHAAQAAFLESFDPIDPARTAFVEGIAKPRRYRGGGVKRSVPYANRAGFRVRSRGPGMLIVNALYLPGWEATVNGRPARVRRAYGILRAVEVPAGLSEVEMRYDPPGFTAGLSISLATLALCLGIVFAERRRGIRTT